MVATLWHCGSHPALGVDLRRSYSNVAYGVAMCGIGMLTLTDTISMDVFGPVADNANGIGEMGDREEMGEENYKPCARQILADLDAVGNTTKAETKGIAIGSAVIAAVSLFASFIAVVAVGSEDKIGQMTVDQYAGGQTVRHLSPRCSSALDRRCGAIPVQLDADPGSGPRLRLRSSKECRIQFRDKEIWAGTKKPDYARVVNTATAQSELIGPALLAILMPILVGIFLGSQALGGYLAGMIIVGQLLAVFMANAGSAWDNAKRPSRTAFTVVKAPRLTRQQVTGDTVGDPLKDTAGPALNPLIKVMNMQSPCSCSIVPILDWSERGPFWLYVVGLLCIAKCRLGCLAKQDRKQGRLREMGEELAASAEAAKSLETVGSTH